MAETKLDAVRPSLLRSPTLTNGLPTAPASTVLLDGERTAIGNANAVLELSDGSAFQGSSFGAPDKSVSGECVFQTGEHIFSLPACPCSNLAQVWLATLNPLQTLPTRVKFSY